MILTCKCGATNRLPALPKSKMRCGKCKHEFTPRELVAAKHEAPSAFQLPIEDDSAIFDEYYCIDDEDCGWDGTKDELENSKCPECGGRVRKVEG